MFNFLLNGSLAMAVFLVFGIILGGIGFVLACIAGWLGAPLWLFVLIFVAPLALALGWLYHEAD